MYFKKHPPLGKGFRSSFVLILPLAHKLSMKHPLVLNSVFPLQWVKEGHSSDYGEPRSPDLHIALNPVLMWLSLICYHIKCTFTNSASQIGHKTLNTRSLYLEWTKPFSGSIHFIYNISFYRFAQFHLSNDDCSIKWHSYVKIQTSHKPVCNRKCASMFCNLSSTAWFPQSCMGTLALWLGPWLPSDLVWGPYVFTTLETR